MATGDWDWIFVLSMFAILSGFAFIYYEQSFDDFGHPAEFNLTYNMSANGSITGIDSDTAEGISYLKSLRVQQPDNSPVIIKRIFGTLFGVFLSILIYRLFRSGGG